MPLSEKLWFAWKFVPLWYQQQRIHTRRRRSISCDLLENLYLCGISNNRIKTLCGSKWLWFAWKFVPLWYQQQPDLTIHFERHVVICLKICTFVVSATTTYNLLRGYDLLWFAWKFVPLWYQQQHLIYSIFFCLVVICLKICTFVVSATTEPSQHLAYLRCDLLENLYLCGISNNQPMRTIRNELLWFAWKFVPLWYQQQRISVYSWHTYRCDLLENLYLCGISNNGVRKSQQDEWVVICLKICTFVVSATTRCDSQTEKKLLWFAWKFVPLWYQQQHL